MERGPRGETVNQDLSTIYSSFRDLEKFGGKPADEGGFTYKRYLICPDRQCDFLEGRYLGEGLPIQISYRIGTQGAHLVLAQDSQKQVALEHVILYEQQEVEIETGSKINKLVPAFEQQSKPDIKKLINLIKRAKLAYTEERERARLIRTIKRDFEVRSAERKQELERLEKERMLAAEAKAGRRKERKQTAIGNPKKQQKK